MRQGAANDQEEENRGIKFREVKSETNNDDAAAEVITRARQEELTKVNVMCYIPRKPERVLFNQRVCKN